MEINILLMPATAEVYRNQSSGLDVSCQYVRGVGPRRAILLKRLGIETVRDILYFSPRRYDDRRHFTPIRRLQVGEFQTIRAVVAAHGVKDVRRRMSIFQLAVQDGTGVIVAVWFNQPYLEERFKNGDTVILSGKVQWYGRERRLMTPEYEILEGDASDVLHTGRIVPVYPLTDGLSQRMMRVIVHNALEFFLKDLREYMPPAILESYALAGLQDAVAFLHFPESMDGAARAKYRLAFEEFFLIQLGVEARKTQQEKIPRPYLYEDVEKIIAEFVEKLPFPLTRSQREAVSEIVRDLESPHPMNRLLQGDVGSGKTLVALSALFAAARCGMQGVLIVPTEVLAQQHALTLEMWLTPRGIASGRLIGDEKPKVKAGILESIRSGRISVVTGTHALLQENVLFHRLGMVVIDEQHRFGVMQRSDIRKKGHHPDVLVMTATPIPRTLAMTLYGELDVSVLTERPPGRGEISTHWIRGGKLNDAYGFIRGQIKTGAQAFIIYPLVEESERRELKAATKMFKHLSEFIFPDLRLGLVHGRMSADEKNAVIYAFRDGTLDILVSTTVIEVGIDIPNANVMLIENAHIFGLAQLHQLRGRIGRGPRRSYCILEGEPATPDGVERLKTMARTNDGFKIAEADLSIRGPGEVLGTRQHGFPELKFGNLVSDIEIIKRAREAACGIFAQDPRLELPHHHALAVQYIQRLRHKAEFFSV